jgi:hypothetical protein
MEIIEMARGRKTGGRKPGSLNRNTLVGKGVSEIFKHMMGIDDEAVERTGQINREGYGFRRRWQEILDGERNPDPAYTNVVKLSLAYAVGNPGKLQEASKQRESLVFLTTNGMVPWDPRADSMKDITDRMLTQKSEEEKVLALEAKKPAEPVAATDNDSEAPVESLELVQEPPENFTGWRR